MFKLKSFKGEKMVLGNGNGNSKTLKERLIGSINYEISIVNERIEEKGKDWYVLKKIEKLILGEKRLVNENRFWRYDKKLGLLLCQLKLKGISFKYGKNYGKRENFVYKVELDDNGENMIKWLNEMKDYLINMDDNDEMFDNEELNNKNRRNEYRKKMGLSLVE